jgi:hypothetical protein
MSTATPPDELERRTYKCARCGTPVPQDQLVAETYCSDDCHDRDRGENLLENIRHDHRFCYNCFRRTKEIEKPPQHAPDVAIGYQYLTENAEIGQQERTADQTTIETDRTAPPADRIISGATVCSGCGTIDHRDSWQREEHISSIRDATLRLIDILQIMRTEGQHEFKIDAKTLIRTLTKTARVESPDWSLAVGRAIVDD